jgi:hypothetical protein
LNKRRLYRDILRREPIDRSHEAPQPSGRDPADRAGNVRCDQSQKMGATCKSTTLTLAKVGGKCLVKGVVRQHHDRVDRKVRMAEPQAGSRDATWLQHGKLQGSTPTVRREKHFISPGAAYPTGGISVVPRRGDNTMLCEASDMGCTSGRALTFHR